MYPRVITDTTVTVHINGKIHVADKSHVAFARLRLAAIDQNWDDFLTLISTEKAIASWSSGNFVVEDNRLLHKGEPVPDVLERRVIGFLDQGAPVEHLLAFYERLLQNPSKRSVDQLYGFLEHENIPIGEDGCFYAYKSVRQSWMDWHSNSCYNGIGETLSMPRNKVDDNPSRGCSYGYHVGSLKYASNFHGGPESRLLIVRVDPANVVSVPYDCQFQKVRTSEYTVVQQYTGPLPDTFWTPKAVDDGVFEGDDEDLDERVQELEDEISRLESDYEDQLDALQTALDAAADAGVSQDILDGIANNISDVESQRDSEIGPLEEELWELT